MTTRIDYATTYFPYNTPTPIQGEPTYKALKRLKNELRANASSVDTDLGGGDHGYLGLVLTDEEYAKVAPNHPFVPPEFPGPLVIPPRTDIVDAMNMRETHKRDTALYRECREVEKALMRHITTAVESKYIDFLKNEYTDLIEDDIPTVLEFLFSNYGKVPTRSVKEKETEVLTTPFVPSDPMVTIYRPIEQLRKLAEIARIPYTESQIVDFGIQLIKNTRDFETALGEWNRKPDDDKTWEIFKQHFQDAQQTLKDIRGPTMAQAGYHHANHLATEIREELKDSQFQMLALLKNMSEVPAENNPDIEDLNTNIATANIATQVTMQTETLKVLQEMQKQLQNLSNEVKNGNKTNKKREYKKTPDDPPFTRKDTDKYCWTHGGCNHNSNACTRQAPGHKKDATRENKLGGSKAFCE